MKRYILATDQPDLRNMTDVEFLKYVCNELKSRGIDTTLHKYEMKAEAYERYSSGETYVVNFKCPGDYLAYFAMKGHTHVRTLNGLAEVVTECVTQYLSGDAIDFHEYFQDYGANVEEICEHASDFWWGDGDDYIIYLKNLDTGKTLYQGDDTEPGIYDEDDENWDSWDD